jgi:MarR family transcriptional regulator for hemolysin
MDETEIPLGRQIAVAARLWRAELDRRLQSLDLSQARFVLLVHLTEAHGPIAQNDLAERAGISGPTLVRHLDQLQNHGLVERQDAPDDRRVKHVCLTRKGRMRCAAAEKIAGRLRDELVAPFPEDLVRQTQNMLQNLVISLESMRAGPSIHE